MKEEKINGHMVKYFESIEEMPIMRYHKFNKYLLIESGIGSDVSDVIIHIDRAIKYAEKSPKDAITELINAKQAIRLANEEISPQNLSFASLVYEIDSVLMTDLSDEGLGKVIKILSGERQGFISRLIEAVKKKTETELNVYFPKLFDDALQKEYYDLIRKRALLVLGTILKKAQEKEVDEVEFQLLMLARPKNFIGRDSVEVNYDKQFDKMNLMIQQNTGSDPKTMTVLEYYNAFEYMKEELKRKKK